MAAKTAPSKKLSNSNTKQEMLAAYGELLQQLEAQSAAEDKPQDKIEQRITAEAVKVADELSTEGVVKQVGELRSNIGRLLSQVASNLEEQVDRYAQISKAIALKEKELAEIYEIQRSALSLAALLQAQQLKRDEFEQEMSDRRQELNTEIEQARSEWEAQTAQRDADLKERDAAENRRRKREEEEYRYAFAREQQLAKDRAADEQSKAHREFATRKEQAERDLAERTNVIAAREVEYADLRAAIDGFPAEREAAVQRAIQELTQRVVAEHQGREEMLKRDVAGERNVFATRIAALESTLKEQTERIARLTQQADKAYSQVQDIAVKAIEGSSNFKSLSSLQQLLSDQPRRQTPEK